MDEAIIQYMRKQCNLHVGERTAQAIKYEVGSAAPLNTTQRRSLGHPAPPRSR